VKILVVDDDASTVRLITGLLRSRGYDAVSSVGTAREALDALDAEPDLVLLDHQLPDASGLDVLDAIRARPQPPAVIMVTAHGTESLAAAALRHGADDYLAKDATLAALLPQLLERVRRGRELRKALAAAEADLVRAERLAAIGEMTVTLHHEINNPLMAAFADVELMLQQPDAPPEGRQETLRAVLASLRRIRDILRRVGELREVRTKSYAQGLTMVDLGGAAAVPAAPFRGGAVVLVPDEDLARVVSLLLRHAGFEVQRCSTVADLQSAAGAAGISLVVLPGGTAAAGAHPLGGFDPPPRRGYRVVALASGSRSSELAGLADLVIELPFDPGSFLADVVGLVGAPA
jgi:DNA-binding response OmpR family regulator